MNWQELSPEMKKGKVLVLPSPFFPGILFSRKPPETQGKGRFFEKNDGCKEWGINP